MLQCEENVTNNRDLIGVKWNGLVCDGIRASIYLNEG